MTFLGIDLGTSGLRALLVDADGAPIGATERHYGVEHPHPGWSEQDPANWIAALGAAVDEMRETYPSFADLRGIGVAGHMHGATLLGEAGEVLRPCILWNDTRSHAEATELDQADGVRALSGNIVFPGFTAPKLQWVRNNEPDIFRKIAKVLLPAAYLNYYLTGDYVADMSDSAGTSWLDVGKRAWSDRLLEASHMRRDQMPRLVEGSDAAGTLRNELAQQWGLSNAVTVAGGAGDNAAAACGIGALDEGQGFVSLGTSGVLLAARDGYRPAPETAVHTFCHAIPDRWYQMGVMLSATDSLNWLARIIGKTPSELTAALGDSVHAPGKVRFLPYLSGERTPHNDAEIRGGFTGLSTGTTQEDLTRAVLEGVAFGLRDSFDALAATGAKMEKIIAIGGGSASRYWLQLISTTLGVPLELPGSGEFGAALGSARLGMIASTGAASESVISPPDIHDEVRPDKEQSAAFEGAYHAFRAAYPGIKAIQ
ncbi:xylulokinase [Aliiroseovarius sp. S1339]|uniref:xylulokinase n=1 Tax=Aliiroseovarius sp. S1339 TaxID=2936990 RepID=UPI0020C0229B|nr:xylulokinase [Aliiroseovarius sp. S1339]MCK8464048.1 xylulokinase [Aliiroseovarius sp. S1339]